MVLPGISTEVRERVDQKQVQELKEEVPFRGSHQQKANYTDGELPAAQVARQPRPRGSYCTEDEGRRTVDGAGRGV